ncbi:hypothetical protein GC722_10700 [Auraticoccus sp. F435]|uniref:YCII-related domain-containing protein n=1 Tax=Auraticoccus cholistanensis TaxID=2656650 RepID=A0A6A9V0Y9_9ACTN|nr:YciI family protein [Auraticoccus cholistanensis]MVA76489.1 hypothetical protein [Auraticoccus cholistanensis]
MTRYLISFDDGDMTFPEEDLPDVSRDSHEVVARAKDAGVWVTGGGVLGHTVAVVATDGSVTDATTRGHLGGFSVLEVASREEALRWAADLARACRCPQQVRELMDDPDV